MNFVMKQALGGKINSFYSLHAHTNVTFCTHGCESDGWNCRSANFCMSMMSFQVEEVSFFFIPLVLSPFPTFTLSLSVHTLQLCCAHLPSGKANWAHLTVTGWLFVPWTQLMWPERADLCSSECRLLTRSCWSRSLSCINQAAVLPSYLDMLSTHFSTWRGKKRKKRDNQGRI